MSNFHVQTLHGPFLRAGIGNPVRRLLATVVSWQQRYELRRAGQRMALEPKAFDLLLYLVEHRDRVVGRDELLDRVWPEERPLEPLWFWSAGPTAGLTSRP